MTKLRDLIMQIRAVIVEDEFQSRNFLVKILSKLYPSIDVVGEASSVDEAIEKIKALRPNLVFLDIVIQDRNVFEIFDNVDDVDFEVIFTTAFDEFAVKAFKFNALDYLLKPIDLDDLDAALKKVTSKLQTSYSSTRVQLENLLNFVKNRDKTFNKIAIPTSNGFMLVPLDDVVYCRSDGNYTIFFLADNRKVTSSYTLNKYDEMLTSNNFFRAHKSYLVNIDHITRYIKGEGGSVMMSNGHEIEVSRRNKEQLIRLLKF